MIIFNPAEDQTFTLNVMLNQVVIYTVIFTLGPVFKSDWSEVRANY